MKKGKNNYICGNCNKPYTRGYPRRNDLFDKLPCSSLCRSSLDRKRKLKEVGGWYPSQKSLDPREVKFFRTHLQMKSRCNLETNPSFNDYGGRGIKVCEEWQTLVGFTRDMWLTFVSHYDEFGRDTQIDRIDND